MSSIPNGQKDEWSSASQELFRAARSDHAPTSADRERVRRALAERIAVGPGAASPGSLAGHAGSVLSRVLKVGFGVSLVVAATIAVKRTEAPTRVVQPAAVSAAAGSSGPVQIAAAPSGAPAKTAENTAQAAVAQSAVEGWRSASSRGDAQSTREAAAQTRDNAAASARAGRRVHGRAAPAPVATTRSQPSAAVADSSPLERASAEVGPAHASQPAVQATDSRGAHAETNHAALAQSQRPQDPESVQAAAEPRPAARDKENDTAARLESGHGQQQISETAAVGQRATDARASATEKQGDSRAEDARAELVFVRKMQAALRAGEADEVLELSQEHAERWPRGTFVQEREGLGAIASCSTAAQSAALRAKAFLTKYPRTPLGPRVREACKLQLEAPGAPAAISGETRGVDR